MSGFSGAVEGGVLHGYDVVNNLTTTVAGKVLDARQGKALSDAIAQSTAKGTFTPTLTGSGNASGIVVSNGEWFKAGKIVFVSFRWSTPNENINKYIQVGNMPFTFSSRAYGNTINSTSGRIGQAFAAAGTNAVNLYFAQHQAETDSTGQAGYAWVWSYVD